jgi:hypothetical protein
MFIPAARRKANYEIENWRGKAPAYLRPAAQFKLLHTAADCLAVIELAVIWEAEKLHGVEGPGPFDEF